jgi:hypothetical protein
MTTHSTTPNLELKAKTDAQLENEIYSIMRATGRSRVQVLNAIKVRGPVREDVMRALAK